MNKLKNWTLLPYFALSLIYLELVFRFATVGGYIFAGDFFIAALLCLHAGGGFLSPVYRLFAPG